MKNLVLAVLFILAISGCAQKVWVNPTKTSNEARRDLMECQQEVNRYGFVPNYGMGIAAGIEEGMRKNEIMTGCMQMKGYDLRVVQDK